MKRTSRICQKSNATWPFDDQEPRVRQITCECGAEVLGPVFWNQPGKPGPVYPEHEIGSAERTQENE